MRYGCRHCFIGLDEIGSVAFEDFEAGEMLDYSGDASACGLFFHRDGNRVTVVLNEVEERELFQRGYV